MRSHKKSKLQGQKKSATFFYVIKNARKINTLKSALFNVLIKNVEDVFNIHDFNHNDVQCTAVWYPSVGNVGKTLLE